MTINRKMAALSGTMLAIVAGVFLALFASNSSAQLYNQFGPANGVLKGQTTTPQTSAAASSDIIGLWTGTCSSGTFLRGDGACAAAGGGSGANPTASVGLTAVNGSATTFMRSDAAPPLSQSISPTMTGTWKFFPTSGAAIIIVGNSSGFGFGVDAGMTGADIPFSIANHTSSINFLQIRGDGSIQMASLPLSSSATTGSVCWSGGAAAGNLTVDTTLACLSSTRRIKDHISLLGNALGEVMQLRPVSYNLKPQFNPKHLGRQVGLVAEDVQKIDPRLVGLDSSGRPLGVRYMQMTALLVRAIQQQQMQIDSLNQQLRLLQHGRIH